MRPRHLIQYILLAALSASFTLTASAQKFVSPPRGNLAVTTLFLPLIRRETSSPTLGGCSVFPADNAWNTDISNYPLHSNSANFINNILTVGGRANLHPDFGADWNGGPFGIPYVVVPQAQALVPINFTAYGADSDPGPYPVPADAPVEGGSDLTGDRHVLVLQSGTCKLYEMYRSFYTNPGWDADSGAMWDLNSNARRPEGWTSADAAGLPILPGLARYDEVAAGEMRHALRFTVSRSQHGYIYPATHYASSITDPNYPPMGLRLRLKAGYDISGFTGQSLVILRALKKYGLIVADNGSAWFISGAPDARWDDNDLNQLKGVPGSEFEVVDTGPVITSAP
jgi:hypothetical protein